MAGLFQVAAHRATGWWGIGLLVASCALCVQSFGAEAKPEKPAPFKISGYGFIRDWQLKVLLRNIEQQRLKQETLDAAVIEDCALILMSEIRKDGHLRPSIKVDMTLADGQKTNVVWQEAGEPPLPRTLSARKVHFRIKEGVRYHYKGLSFIGLKSVKRKQARAYFVQTGVLPFRASRIFSEEALHSGISSLTEVLQRQGYQDAQVTVGNLQMNDRSGAVNVRLDVKQGPLYLVRSVRLVREAEDAMATNTTRVVTFHTNRPYSRIWEQDAIQRLKATNFHRGFPDTTVTIEPIGETKATNTVHLDLQATVKPGPKVYVGQVEFHGAKRTRHSVLENRIPLDPGDVLDRLLAEHGRNRLARLGTFDSIDLRYERVDEHTRNVIYDLKEAKATTISLLGGYGSYEMLRGGVELHRNNIFGLAHSARMRAIQSFKASQGDFTYTIPELVGEDIDGFANGFALRREEISFTREEYGGGAGLHRYFPDISTDVVGRYNYQVLNAVKFNADFAAIGPTNPGVGAVILDLRHDRRNNPLYPTRGYKVFTTFELASEYLAGDVTYQRLELAGSYHLPLVQGLRLNLGLSHGLITSPESANMDVPFNKRFFPGGADSIRGYQEGEASPRNAEGKLIGAESFLLGTVELEQALTRWLSLVVFSDNLGSTQRISRYPFDETLYSVGGGVRFRTIVGPIRLEYGHNLNRRTGDPSGTLHFSLGFPF